MYIPARLSIGQRRLHDLFQLGRALSNPALTSKNSSALLAGCQGRSSGYQLFVEKRHRGNKDTVSGCSCEESVDKEMYK